jgi:hypothetical protein
LYKRHIRNSRVGDIHYIVLNAHGKAFDSDVFIINELRIVTIVPQAGEDIFPMAAVFEEDGCCDTVRNFACYMIGYQKTVGITYELQNILTM